MRKIIVCNAVSLDGFYADADGNPPFLVMEDSFDQYNLERIQQAGTVLLGRTSFEMFGSYWPGIADAPEAPGRQEFNQTNRELSRIYNGLPKVVVSDSLVVPADHPWHQTTSIIARDGAVAWVKEERERGSGNILIYGSHILWNALLAEGLVDELHFMVGAGTYGAGTQAFSGPNTLKLLAARQFPGSSNILLTYRPAETV